VVERLCRESGARDVRVATDAAERARLWQGRKKAFGAMGRLAPHLVVQDAVVPRTRLPEVLARIHEIGARRGVRRLQRLPRRRRQPAPTPRSLRRRTTPTQARPGARGDGEIMRRAWTSAATITGEHGVGLDKQGTWDLTLATTRRSPRCAALRDVFDPGAPRDNPGKVVPVHAAASGAPRRGRRGGGARGRAGARA
jgi:glycolate oxidase